MNKEGAQHAEAALQSGHIETMPSSKEFEEQVLAAVVFGQDEKEVSRQVAVLEEEKLFYWKRNQELLKWIRRLIDEGAGAPLQGDGYWGVLAAAVRHRAPKFWDEGAKELIPKLLEWFVPNSNFDWIVEQLVTLAVTRERISIANRELRGLEGRGPDEMLEFWENQNEELQRRILDRKARVRQAVYAEDYLQELEEKHRRMREGQGLTLGLPTVDQAMSGLTVGEMVCLCARAGVGKTTLCANLLAHRSRPATRDQGWRVVFSLDMAASDFFEKMLMRSRAMGWKELFRVDQRDQTHEEGLSVHGRTLLDNSAALRVSELEARVMAYRATMDDRPPELVILDHHGHLKPKNRQLRSRYEIASETIIDLKQAAKRLETVIVCIVQLSRKAGEGDVEVGMDMLRDSGVIEETGDLILGAWRPNKGKPGEDDTMKLKVMKARRMAGTVIDMEWRPEVAFVGEMAEDPDWWEGTGAPPERDDKDEGVPF